MGGVNEGAGQRPCLVRRPRPAPLVGSPALVTASRLAFARVCRACALCSEREVWRKFAHKDKFCLEPWTWLVHVRLSSALIDQRRHHPHGRRTGCTTGTESTTSDVQPAATTGSVQRMLGITYMCTHGIRSTVARTMVRTIWYTFSYVLVRTMVHVYHGMTSS